ncbi:MAG: SIMPL domain-containing protein [Parcubacteria group bacterium]|nr:SIMPL domain-containing protein [Parcubacteria group bacterium]
MINFNDMGNDQVVRYGLIALLFAGALFLLAGFISEFKALRFVGQDAQFTRTITVSGAGEAFAIADTAEFTFAVIEEAKTIEAAQKVVTETTNALLSYLKSAGVEEKHLKTTSYNIAPRYDYDTTKGFPSGDRVLVGYEVSHWVSVKTKKTDKVGELLAQIGSRGATNISSVNFTVEDEDEVRREARIEAIEDARVKAKQLADDLGVRIVKVVNFYESGGGPIYFAREAAFGMGGDMDKAALPPTPDIPIGENTVMVNVNITYAID